MIIWGRPEQIVPAKESGSRRAGDKGARGKEKKARIFEKKFDGK